MRQMKSHDVCFYPEERCLGRSDTKFDVVTGFHRDMDMRKFILGLAPYPAVLGRQRRAVNGRGLL